MSNDPTPTMTVDVDVTNPGQFFACCGLLELADRLWPGAEGWFDGERLCIAAGGSLEELLQALTAVDLEQLDPADDMASPMRIPEPFNLTLRWWADKVENGKQLKAWAGSMRSVRIARAMQKAIGDVENLSQLLNWGEVIYDPENPKKKVEPYYYDSRRGWNAQARDIGFAPDSLRMTTAAYPAVEFLSLVGLERFKPGPTDLPRVFTYATWSASLPITVAPAVVCGVLAMPGATRYRFQNAFRTDQRKHKSFLPATPIGDSQ